MQYLDDPWETFKQLVLSAARNVSQRSDHKLIAPYDSSVGPVDSGPLRIGLFGNMANQAYITARALRRLGHQVDVVIQPNMIDLHHLSQPFWEETEGEAHGGAITAAPHDWTPPDFCRFVPYDLDLQVRYQNRLSAVPEVTTLYRDVTGVTLAEDVALLLSQHMGHWNYIVAMNDYDVVQLSTWPVVLGVFCPKPYVVCPLGGELYITAFEENVQGLLCRAGFRSADRIAFPETDYPAYLDRLGTIQPRDFVPLIVDTDVYRQGAEEDLRAAWQAEVGGSRYLLSVCRQSWDWKGSDRLIRAFAGFHQQGGAEWRLMLQAWGDDLDRSRALVAQLGLDTVTAWLPMCSKPQLRARQRAADVVADQFVMEGYGTSVLESMAAGKPVIMSPVPSGAEHHFRVGPPPLIAARTVAEIEDALKRLDEGPSRLRAGQASRRWVEDEHGHLNLVELYLATFEAARGARRTDRVASDASSINREETVGLLRRDYLRRRDQIREQWDRVVPYGDQLTDRWEKARYLGFGDGTSVYDSTLVLGRVSVGSQTWIGPNCVLDGSGGLEIGSTCSVSAGCQIYSHDTVAWAVSGGQAATRHASTRVCDAVYLGPGTIVTAGSTIGEHSIIGALSLVNGPIPPYSFAVGCPARIRGRVTVGPDGQVSVQTGERIEEEESSLADNNDGSLERTTRSGPRRSSG